MNDWEIRKTIQGDEWSINAYGGTREIELERECHDGSTHYLFLTKDDITKMERAL